MDDHDPATTATTVVGIDDSDAAPAVLRHAVLEASRRHGRVHAISTYEPPEGWSWAYGLDLQPELERIGEAALVHARGVVDRVLADLPRDLDPVPELELDVVAGRAGDVLVDSAAGADMLVVGHRGRGRLGSIVFGSVGLSCVLHAPCPVTVVPAVSDDPPAAAAGTVVVGVDGSDCAREALQHALRDADRRGDRVLAISVYEPPEDWNPWSYGLAVLPGREELERRQLALTRRFVDEVVASIRPELATEPKVEVQTHPGTATHVLTVASRGADALHIGPRGRGAVGSAALGSVGLGCVVHASCPVTVALPAHTKPSDRAEPAAGHREGEPPGVQTAENELAYERHPRLPGHREAEPIGEQARDAVRAAEDLRRRSF